MHRQPEAGVRLPDHATADTTACFNAINPERRKQTRNIPDLNITL